MKQSRHFSRIHQEFRHGPALPLRGKSGAEEEEKPALAQSSIERRENMFSPVSPDQIRQARRADLVTYLQRAGFELRRENGQFRIPDRGGLVVKDCYWHHFATGNGGNSLDFLVKLLGIPFPQAVAELLGLGQPPGLDIKPPPGPPERAARELRLPEKGRSTKQVFDYLVKERGLPVKLVNTLFHSNLLYQDTKKNAVFLIRDRGKVRGAFLRGTKGPFKGMAPGSENYPWFLPGRGRIAVAGEAIIDVLSFSVIKPYLGTSHLLALNGLSKNALINFLNGHPEVKAVVLALDNDPAGREAAARFKEALKEKVAVVELWPPGEFKDWNQVLVSRRER